MEGSVISVENCTGRAFPVITVRVNCAGQSYHGDIFSKVKSSMISSHEHFFDMSNDDTCLYGGGVCDVEHVMPRQRVHFGGTSDIFSDAVSEGLIKDGFVVVTVLDNITGDAREAEELLVDSIPDALAWNKNRAGANLFSNHLNQMVLYMLGFQTDRKNEIIRNKECCLKATGTDAWSLGTDAYSNGTDKYSEGTDKYSKGTDAYSKGTDKRSMGIAKLPSSKEILNADFELTCKKCNTTRKVDSINGKVKIKKSGSKYVLAKRSRYYCSSCKGEMAAKSIKKL